MAFTASLILMKAHHNSQLAKGQVWKTDAAAIEILGLGEQFIHYKITKELGHKQVSAQASARQAMEDYLFRHEARLVRAASRN